MGLNAVVYINKNNLALDQVNGDIKSDNQTGEVYIEGVGLSNQYPEGTFIALNKRLGNIDTIAAIRAEILKVINSNSIIQNKVLYSGSHSGDIISLEYLDTLESEINLAKEGTAHRMSSILAIFLMDMSELIQTARKQQNPIVFV